MTMEYYAGIDVSLEASSVCVVDASGKIVKEAKVLSELDDLIAWFKALPFALARIGLEAGPLSQWLYAGLKKARFAVELLETRQRLQGDAGEDGPERCTRHRPADAARLVQASALQIGTRARDPGGSDRTQAGAGKALRYRDEPQGHFAGLWSQGGPDHEGRLRQPDYRADGASPGLGGNRQSASCRA